MPFILLLQREILLSFRHASDTVGTILFFILTSTLFPLALGPEPQRLQQIAPAILWVCALLAALLPMERIFQQDYEDGFAWNISLYLGFHQNDRPLVMYRDPSSLRQYPLNSFI